MFSPLAFTKTCATAAAAGLSATLIPVLMGCSIGGRMPGEKTNPLSRLLIAGYRPMLNVVLRAPKTTLAVASVALVVSLWPSQHIGGEFLPKLDEGDLLCATRCRADGRRNDHGTAAVDVRDPGGLSVDATTAGAPVEWAGILAAVTGSGVRLSLVLSTIAVRWPSMRRWRRRVWQQPGSLATTV